jgi:hypothetical protein
MSGQLKVSVDTTGKAGVLLKHVSIYSNDRVRPVVTVTVSVDIVQKL